MGKRKERREQAIAQASAGLARYTAQQAATESTMREEQLGAAELLLGTEAQFGATSVDPAQRAWEGRYESQPDLIADASRILQATPSGQRFQIQDANAIAFDPDNPYHQATQEAIRAELGPDAGDPTGTAQGWQHPYFSASTYAYEARVGSANYLLDQAQEAYAAGDLNEADRLKAEAEDLIQRTQLPGGAGELGDVFSLQGGELTPEEAALHQLQSPIAQNIGRLVQRGTSYLDPHGAESLRFKREMSEGALENIRGGETEALRNLGTQERIAEGRRRREGTSLGGARSLTGEAAVAARSAERTGLARADIALQTSTRLAELQSSVDTYFNTFALDFAANTSQMGQAFLQNQAGIRDSYQNMISQLMMGAAQFADNMADRAYEAYTQLSLLPPKPNAGMQALGGIVGTVGGAVTGSLLGGGF